MDPLTPARLSSPRRDLHLSHALFGSFSLQPHPSRPVASFDSASAVTGLPLARQASRYARTSDLPYRVLFRSGPTLRLGLLPTPPCGDAVASDCPARAVCAEEMTFTF